MTRDPVHLPPPLPAHARIAVSCPASPPEAEKLERGVARLRQLGHEVTVGATCRAPRGQLHAGDDAARAAEFIGFLEDPGIDAIFAGRGGVGCMRLLPYIERSLRERDLLARDPRERGPRRKGLGTDVERGAVAPKWIIGRSDLTALHLFLFKSLGWIGISGPMVATDLGAPAPPRSVIEIALRLMSDPAPIGRIATAEPLETWVPGDGFAEGRLFPVNLSLLSSLVGTPYLPSFEGAILVLEEIDEPPHRIDRMLTQLRLSGVFSSIAGLVFGQFTACHSREETMPEDLLVRLLQDHARGIGVPAIAGFPYGHEPLFHPLPVGARARVESAADRPAALVLIEGTAG